MRLSETRFVIIDTETTGLHPEEDRVVDVALVEVTTTSIKEVYSSLINPCIPIPPVASAVHHIVDEHVKAAPTMPIVWKELQPLIKDAVLVAHNAKFDSSFLPLKKPWVCSYRLARHMLPNAPKHSNQVLRYWLGIDVGDVPVHRALGDAWVTAHIFQIQLIQYLAEYEDDLEKFLEFVKRPIFVKTMPFGKHKDKPMQEVPRDYLQWSLGNMTDLDADLKWTMETVLKGAIVV